MRMPIADVPAGIVCASFLVLIAFVLRLLFLDARLLLPDEGVRALAAWQLTQGHVPGWWDAPAQSVLSALFFLLFGAGDGVARLPGVIAGSGMVALLWLFRGWLGTPAVLGAGLLLAVSPTALAVSKSTFEEPSAAVLTLVLGWGAIKRWEDITPRAQMLGAAGVAMLFQLGYAGLAGFLVLALFSVAYYSVRPQGISSTAPRWLTSWSRLIVPFVATTLLLSTGFFMYPDGFGVPALQAWVRSFEANAQAAPWHQMWLTIGGYELPVFCLGSVLAGRTLLGWARNPLEHGCAARAFLSVWGVLGLLLYFIAGEPSIQRLFFGLAPLTMLTGIFLGEQAAMLQRRTVAELLPSAILGGVAFMYAALTVSELAGGNAADQGLKFFTVAASVVVAILFVGIGLAQTGQTRSAAVFLMTCVTMIFMVHGSARLIADPWMTHWRLSSYGILPVAQSVSLTPYTSQGSLLQMAVAEDLRPAVAWYLRDTPGVAYVRQTLPGPSLVVNREGLPLADAASYTARTFPLLEVWNPQPYSWRDALRWFINGDRKPEHMLSQRMIVWKKVM